MNLDYYGSGAISLQNSIEIKTRGKGIFQLLQFKLAESPIFFGISQRYVNAEISPRSFGGIQEGLPEGFSDELQRLLSLEVTTSGVGINIEVDARDNVFSPRQGHRFTLDYLWYRESIGSDIDYQNVSIQGLMYKSIAKRWRVGVMLGSEYADSDGLLPPFATPSIRLRGIPAMRYQGKFTSMIEAEMTWQLDPRCGIVGVLGAGRASNSYAEFSEVPSRVTQGVGFRYQIARRYGFDAGLDVAWGPEEAIVYITAGSAWSP